MTSDLPAPLVPAEVDLRDFAFMPLDVQRLRDSDLASDETPEACWAAVLLWCASWHQVPAASIPDNEQWQAKQAGYVARGRIDAQWSKVSAGALRHWVKCSDGRLYHPVVASKANDAWDSKLRNAFDKMADRTRKLNKARADGGLPAVKIPSFADWKAGGKVDPLPPEPGSGAGGIPPEKTLKGQGKGEGDLKPSVPDGTGATAPPPTDRDVVFAAGVAILTASGVTDKNARSFLAMQCKAHGEAAVRAALDRCAEERAIEPITWLQATLKAKPAAPAKSKFIADREAQASRWFGTATLPGIGGDVIDAEEAAHGAAPAIR